MPLLIDCYNVLFAPMPPSLAGLDETGLCHLLANQPWATQHPVVVCDGSVKPNTPAHSPVPEVDLIYSGPKRSADEVIIERINADSAPRRVTVVTSDRQIQKAARRRRCAVISTDKFIKALAETLGQIGSRGGEGREGSAPQSPPRNTPLSDTEVNNWLKQFGFDPEDEDPQTDTRPWWEKLEGDL